MATDIAYRRKYETLIFQFIVYQTLIPYIEYSIARYDRPHFFRYFGKGGGCSIVEFDELYFQ